MRIEELVPRFESIKVNYEHLLAGHLFYYFKGFNQEAFNFFKLKKYNTRQDPEKEAAIKFYNILDRATVLEYLLIKKPVKELKSLCRFLQHKLEGTSNKYTKEDLEYEIKLINNYIALAKESKEKTKGE